MTGQRQHSCVVRLSVVVSKSEIQVHQIHPLCLARPGAGSQPHRSPRARLRLYLYGSIVDATKALP